jgi:hypothetical protein
MWKELSTIHLASANLIDGSNGNKKQSRALFNLCFHKKPCGDWIGGQKKSNPGQVALMVILIGLIEFEATPSAWGRLNDKSARKLSSGGLI